MRPHHRARTELLVSRTRRELTNAIVNQDTPDLIVACLLIDVNRYLALTVVSAPATPTTMYARAWPATRVPTVRQRSNRVAVIRVRMAAHAKTLETDSTFVFAVSLTTDRIVSSRRTFAHLIHVITKLLVHRFRPVSEDTLAHVRTDTLE
jgi:hypothetical protein